MVIEYCYSGHLAPGRGACLSSWPLAQPLENQLGQERTEDFLCNLGVGASFHSQSSYLWNGSVSTAVSTKA